MKTYRLILLAITLLAMTVTPGNYIAGENNITIDNINFGELLMGNGVSKEDLQNCVVGVDFDGMTCQTCPCGGEARTFIEWQRKYSPQGFILVSFYVKEEPSKNFIALCKSMKVPFPIYSGGSISGSGITDLPAFVLFDHNGKVIFSGHPKEKKLNILLANAMKSMPDPLIGEGPYKKLSALADKIKQRKELGQILAALKTKHLDSKDEDEAAEAEKLVEKLTRYGNRLLQKSEAKKSAEPLNAYNLYQEISKMFKGDEIGDNAEKAIKELKEDKTFQDNLKADKELASIMPDIEKLKASTKCATFDKECDACKKKNPSLQILIPKAKNIIKNYPDSPAAIKVKELLPVE